MFTAKTLGHLGLGIGSWTKTSTIVFGIAGMAEGAILAGPIGPMTVPYMLGLGAASAGAAAGATFGTAILVIMASQVVAEKEEVARREAEQATQDAINRSIAQQLSQFPELAELLHLADELAAHPYSNHRLRARRSKLQTKLRKLVPNATFRDFVYERNSTQILAFIDEWNVQSGA